MDIRQLEAFACVARTGSFTKAADELCVTRQAISKTVKHLEEECGVALLILDDNRPTLTEDGARFLEQVAPVLSSFSRLTTFFSPSAAEDVLRIAVSQGLFETTPEDFAADFIGPTAHNTAQIEEASSDGVLSMLKNDEIDICLLGSHPKYLQDFEYVDLAHPGYFVCVPLQSPLATKDHLELSDLESVPFVTLGTRNHLHRFFVEECALHQVKPSIVAESSDAHVLQKYIDNATFSFSCAPKHTRPKGLTIDIPLGMNDAQVFGTYACRRKGDRLGPTAERFWDYLLRCHEALLAHGQVAGFKAHI